MNKVVYLTPDGAKLVHAMLGSCAADSCDVAMSRLSLVRVSTALQVFTDPESGSWQKPVFGSLQAYALAEGYYELGVKEVARYFAGRHHIEAMIRKATHTEPGISNISVLMGLDAGLVLDVLLPLNDGHYQNGGHDLDLGEFVVVSPESSGVPCYHRGLVVKVPLSPAEVADILEEQGQVAEFMAALSRLKSPVQLPPNYLEALRLTCTQ